MFDDGSTFGLDDDYVVGREPEIDVAVAEGSARPLVLDDPGDTVSRVHAEIRLLDWDVKLIDRAVKALGAGVASVVNVLDVETVVIGGGLGTRLGEPYVERIRKAMEPHLFVTDRPPAVRLAALGDLGGAIGASLLVKTRARAKT